MKFLKRVSCCLFLIAILGACNSSSSDSVPGSGSNPVPTPPVPTLDYTHLLMTLNYDTSPLKGLSIKSINDGSWTRVENIHNDKNWTGLAQLKNGTLLASVYTSSSGVSSKYEGIMRSEDLGKTWTTATETKDNLVDMYLQLSDSIILAYGADGVWRSEDGGKTWQPTSITKDIFLQKLSDGTVLGYRTETTSSGMTPSGVTITYKSTIVRSADEGKTWAEVFNESNVSLSAYDCVIEPTNGVILLKTGANGPSSTNFVGILKSSDYGKTWKKISTDDIFQSFVRLSDGKIVAFVNVRNTNKSKIMTSADNGESWEKVHERSTLISGSGSLIVFPNDELLLLSGGVFKSVDKGVTWTSAGTTFENGMFEVELVLKDMIYIVKLNGSENELWKSTDRGTTWTKDAQVNAWPADIVPIVNK